MSWDKLIISMIPLPAFYLIYYRYFTFRPEYIKHLEAFLSGIGFALFISLVLPILFSHVSISGIFFEGFIKAALVEKAGAFIILILLYKYYPNFSLFESILAAMMFGIGFSAVENIFYAFNFGISVIIIRVLFSVPLHMTTCGIMGYYLGLYKMCRTPFAKCIYSIMAIVISVLLHGAFDSIILSGGRISYLASPMLLTVVIILEILIAHSQTMLPFDVLEAMELRLEDWMIITRQPKYERWILQSMGTASISGEAFFLWRPGIARFLLVVLIMIFAIIGLSFRENIINSAHIQLNNSDQIILLGIFPFSVSIILILVGAVNPGFFKNSKIKIPIISDIEVLKDNEFQEVLVTYDITTSNSFLRTAEPLGIGKTINLRFECSKFSSAIYEGEVVWENHTNPHAPTGSVIRLQGVDAKFILSFVLRYHIFRIFKGVVFNLRLPGFESIRKLFMRPVSTMQDVRIFKPGTIVFHEGDKSTEFYLLKKGAVIFYKTKDSGEIITIDTISGEQLFGEMAILGNDMHDVTARCVTECVIAVADRENLNALIKNNTEFVLNLLETLANRVTITERVLFENIQSLENDRDELTMLNRIAFMLVILGQGIEINNNILSLDININKITDSLHDIDKGTILSLLEIINDSSTISTMKELLNGNSSMGKLKEVIKKLDIKIKTWD